MALLLALSAALAYAAAVVLQQRSASTIDRSLSLRPGLLVSLGSQRVWQIGLAINVVAFGLRALALARGSLVLVQPLVLSGLVIALLVEAGIKRRRLTRVEAVACMAIVAGLSTFLLAASPTSGSSSAPLGSWLVLGGAAIVMCIVSVGVAARRAGDRRAAWLALTAGVLLAATAALAKQTASAVLDERLHVLVTWTPYALVVVGCFGVIAVQSAFQAGSLRASLPILTVAEPLASIALGVVVFSERVDASPSALVCEALGLLALFAGVVTLTARSNDASARRATTASLGHDRGMPKVRRIAVMPAYNEAPTVAAVLDRLAPLVDELVVVDDGSFDGTRAAIQGCLPTHPNVRLITFDTNRGMSAAYYAAFGELRSRLGAGALSADDLVFTVDADGQHDLAVLDHLYDLTVDEKLDALLVRRDLSGYPLAKRAGNWVLSAWASLWARHRLSDVESGYRVFRLGALSSALDYYRGYRYSETVEVAVVMCRLGCRVRNDVLVPVPVYRSRTRLRDAAIDLAAIPAAAWRVGRRRPPSVTPDAVAM